MVELNVFLEKFLKLLKNIINEKEKVKPFKRFEATFLDFVSRTKNNVNGVNVLLKEFESNEFIIVPIASIMRTITVDGITIAYLSTFLTDNLKEDQTTFINEINSLHLETLQIRSEISKIENPSKIIYIEDDFYDENNNNKLKNRKQLHQTSLQSLIGGNYKLSKNGFLSEKNKLDRINISSSELKFDVKYCYLANKYFSQYYHYSPIGGIISRTKNQETLDFDIQQIKVGLVASFFILTKILEDINFIKNEDIIELISLADNLARDEF